MEQTVDPLRGSLPKRKEKLAADLRDCQTLSALGILIPALPDVDQAGES